MEKLREWVESIALPDERRFAGEDLERSDLSGYPANRDRLSYI